METTISNFEKKELNERNLSKAINGLFGLVETSDEACNMLMDILGVAMGSKEADVWDQDDRSNVTHLCRHLCNMIRASQPFKTEDD